MKQSFKKTTVISIIAIIAIFSSIFLACNKDRDSNNDVAEWDKQVLVNIPDKHYEAIGHVKLCTDCNEQGKYGFIFEYNASASYINDSDPNAQIWIARIKESIQKNTLVKVFFDGSTVLKVVKPLESEEQKYNDWLKSNTVSTNQDLKSNQSNTLATTSYSLYIPNYTTAVSVFNFLKNQSCSGGSPSYLPCISFGYTGDGCFARAQKMKQIMENQYSYTCYKVFHYGQNYTAGQANLRAKPGSCCTKWIYHVAPLVRVGTASSYTEYVFDPSLFTTPVSRSTWIAAQLNTTCGSVSSYLAVTTPGSYYAPTADYTSYVSDDSYTLTNAWLNGNNYKTGCTGY